MFTKIYGMAKTDSTTMNIQKIPNILTKHMRESLENSKMRWQVYQLLNSLQSEVYSYVKDKNKGDKTAKGIKRNVMKKDIKHTDYENTLFNNEQIYHKMKTIKGNNHQLGSYKLNKVSPSCFDHMHTFTKVA